jgi:tetratricopeptide (TPR) repeat protein
MSMMRTASTSSAPSAELDHILRLAREGRLSDAAVACDTLLAAQPADPRGWRVASQLHQRRRDFERMLAAAAQAEALAGDVRDSLRHVECLLYCGRTTEALARLERLEDACAREPRQLLAIAALYTQCNRHREAHRCHEHAFRLAPSDRHARAALAATSTAFGRLEQAEVLLTALVTSAPDDGDAWLNLANLRRWDAQHNHVEPLARLLAAPQPPAAEAPVCYALFKELEDLGEQQRAVAVLRRGADARRRSLRYRVERDVAVMEAIRESFPPAAFVRAPGRAAGGEAIFIMGLPRSGTTLVDRILCSLPEVESLGELRDFTFAVMRLAGPDATDQAALVRRSAELDFEALGAAYLAAVASWRSGAPRFIDKTPAHYLYAGLLRLALPEARLVLLRRHPLEACYAMYKTLFQAGYPFSYDLEDLVRYYAAWHRLVEHWRSVMPGALIEIEYEALVADPEAESRGLLQRCGLAWDPRCLDFHRNPSPSATASASQVRRPIYRSSLTRARDLGTLLDPLPRLLREAGIPVD